MTPHAFGTLRSRRTFWLGCFLLFAVLFTLYSVSFGHNFLFDEENIIIKNPVIRDLSRIPELFSRGYFYFDTTPGTSWKEYYRPLVSLTFALDYHFWQLNPLGYNLTNIFWHGLVCVLLFALFLRILRHETAAFLAALLYAVHTIHTEAVTYTASRGDLMGGCFILAALLFYGKGRPWAALGCYVPALLSKESALLLPFYVAVLDFCFIRSAPRRFWTRLLPFVGVGVLYVLYRKLWCPVDLGPPSNEWGPALLRVFSMGGPLLSYADALLFPESFKFSESVSFAEGWGDPRVFQTLAVGGALLAAWLLAARRRGAAFFGMSLFLAGLAPYLHFIHFYPEWSEHYLYIPSMGLALLAGLLLKRIFLSRSAALKGAALFLCLAFIVFLSARTWERNSFYNDQTVYYDRLTQSDSPYAFYGYHHKAREALENRDWKRAVVFLKTAEAIEPFNEVTHNLLGYYYSHEKDYANALRHYKKAYQYSHRDYRYLLNIAVVLVRLGRYEEAADILLEIQKRFPLYAAAYTNLITAYELKGDQGKAEQWAETGLRQTGVNPFEYAKVAMAAARWAYRQDRPEKTREILNEFLGRHPDIFWYSDVARLLTGGWEAERFLRKVATDYPGFETMAKIHVLNSYGLSRRAEAMRDFLKRHEALFREQGARHPQIQAELDKAEALAAF